MAGTVAALALVLSGMAQAAPAAATQPTSTPIKHFLFMLQGDRSFDNYFGSYPGADGIPADACQKPIVTGPATDCVRPFSLHGTAPADLGAGSVEINNQYDGGRMDGFVAAYQNEGRDGTSTMGYYDRRDLPSYWGLADNYVLFDRFFSATRSGTAANRSFWVSGSPPPVVANPVARQAALAKQLTIFDRLQAAGIDWKFYVQGYNPQLNFRTVSKSNPSTQPLRVPLLNYARFVDDPALASHIVDLSEYYRDLERGTLPAVAYLASSGPSERSARSIAGGQKLTSDLVSSLMISKYWDSSAFLLSYDGSGGWFDHVAPPQVDGSGYGLRVPALLVSAYARQHYVDSTTSDYTSALAFIEHNWNLAPLAGRDAGANPLAGAFDFTAPPRGPQLQFAQVPSPPQKQVASAAIVYWCYGLALLIVLAAVLFAYGNSRRTERREPALPEALESPALAGAKP